MLAAVALIAFQYDVSAARPDLASRLVEFERAWAGQSSTEARREAVGPFGRAVAGFLGGNRGEACRNLDQALATLQGREPAPEDALVLTVTPPVVEPGGRVVWRVRKSYDAGAPGPATLEYAGLSLKLGENAPATGESEPLQEDTEFLLRVGKRRLRAKAAVVPGIEETRRRAEGNEHPELLAFVLDYGAREKLESEVDWHSRARRARAVLDGDPASYQPEERKAAVLPTVLRAYVPKGGAKVAVVAVHGAGGSENMFFEAYGAGVCVQFARERGWAFVAPRIGPSAVQDSLRYLASAMPEPPSKVLLMGHSAGGGAVLAAMRAGVRADAVALFAPAAGSWPAESEAVPAFLAVGAQEFAMLATGAERLRAARTGVEFFRPDPCEHYLVVGESAAKAYEFFDRTLAGLGW